MATRAFLRSATRAFLRSAAICDRLRVCGARSWPPWCLLPPPPPSNEKIKHMMEDSLAACVAAFFAAVLRSLETKGAIGYRPRPATPQGCGADYWRYIRNAHQQSRAPPAPPQRLNQRALHSSLNGSSSSTPPTSILDALAKARAGVAYVTLLGSLIYMYGWVMPRLDRLEGKLKALKSLNDCLTKATNAVELFLADQDAPPDVSLVQSSGLGNQQPDGMTGNRTRVDNLEETKELETLTKDYQAEITKLKDLEAEITKLQIALESRSKEKPS